MVSLDAVVLPAFGPDDAADLPGETDELTRWERSHDFEESVPVPTATAPLRYAQDRVGLVQTGMGKAAAASTVAGVLAAPSVDVADALWVTVGVAGGPPDGAPLGSVVVGDAVVDWDLKHRRGPDEIEPLAYRPHDYVWQLDDELVARAAKAARGADLRTDPAAEAFDHELGRNRTRPEVVAGPTLCGDEFWHGTEMAGQAERLCGSYGVDGYATTEMEDAGTATALDRAGALDRYVSVRAVSNYDRPVGPDGGDGFEAGYELALTNAFRAGRAVVEALR